MKIILLIDDDIEDHDTIKQAFYAVDSTVHCLCYTDCDDAITRLANHTIPQLHCILIDLHMPRMSGLECLKALRNMLAVKGADIIMMSSQFREEDVDELCRFGAKAFCVKPNSWDGYRAMAEMILNDKIQVGGIVRA